MEISKKESWLERVEEIVNVLEGSSIGELELVEDGTEIIIRRQPGMVLTTAPTSQASAAAPSTSATPRRGAKRVEPGVAIVAPLTGVYYSAASPSMPPFVNIGDVVQVGQVVALIEAMKVFNEINAEVSGKVVAIVATSGNVVQKGEVLLRIEPA
ncbi:MAG TPA: biotin/lipoyl-containing protein [Ktedonobacteraceae bacterium]|jgi:acetyl-CoA carboxylase biotin carboxyl carrier protein|nr:biotin/lipoyl-containing protein [Ktedonobacteraceae bacterium]